MKGRADAAGHRPSVYTGAVTAEPDMLPDGLAHAGPRSFDRDRLRSPAMSARLRPEPRLA
jgi:hypothetical protein